MVSTSTKVGGTSAAVALAALAFATLRGPSTKQDVPAPSQPDASVPSEPHENHGASPIAEFPVREEVKPQTRNSANNGAKLDLNDHVQLLKETLARGTAEAFYDAQRYVSTLQFCKGLDDPLCRNILREMGREFMKSGTNVASILAAKGDLTSAASVIHALIQLDPSFELNLTLHEGVDYQSFLAAVLDKGGVNHEAGTRASLGSSLKFDEYLRKMHGQDFEGSLAWRDLILNFATTPLFDLNHFYELAKQRDRAALEGYLASNAQRYLGSVDVDPEGSMTGAFVALRLMQDLDISVQFGLEGTVLSAAEERFKRAASRGSASPEAVLVETYSVMGILRDFGPSSGELERRILTVAHRSLSQWSSVSDKVVARWNRLLERNDLEPGDFPL